MDRVLDRGYPESFSLSNEFTCLLLVSSGVLLRIHSEILGKHSKRAPNEGRLTQPTCCVCSRWVEMHDIVLRANSDQVLPDYLSILRNGDEWVLDTEAHPLWQHLVRALDRCF